MTTPIIVNQSTTLVQVDTSVLLAPYIVLLSNLNSPGSLLTIRDSTGNASLTNNIIISTTVGVKYLDGGGINSNIYTINQPYGFLTVTPKTYNIWGVTNTFAFPDASASANLNLINVSSMNVSTIGYIQRANISTALISTLCTVNVFIEKNISVGESTIAHAGFYTCSIRSLQDIIGASDIYAGSTLSSMFANITSTLTVPYISTQNVFVYGGLQTTSSISTSGPMFVGSSISTTGNLAVGASTFIQGQLTVLQAAFFNSSISTKGALNVGFETILNSSLTVGSVSTLSNMTVGGSLSVMSTLYTRWNSYHESSILASGSFSTLEDVNIRRNLSTLGNVFIGREVFTRSSMLITGAISTLHDINVRSNVSILGNLYVRGDIVFDDLRVDLQDIVASSIYTQYNISTMSSLIAGGFLHVNGSTLLRGTVCTLSNFNVRGLLSTASSVIVGDSLNVFNTGLFGSNISTPSSIGVGNRLNVGGPTNLQGFLSTFGQSAFYSSMQIQGSLSVMSSIAISWNLDVGNSMTTKNMSLTGSTFISTLAVTNTIGFGLNISSSTLHHGLFSTSGAMNIGGLISTTNAIIVGSTMNTQLLAVRSGMSVFSDAGFAQDIYARSSVIIGMSTIMRGSLFTQSPAYLADALFTSNVVLGIPINGDSLVSFSNYGSAYIKGNLTINTGILQLSNVLRIAAAPQGAGPTTNLISNDTQMNNLTVTGTFQSGGQFTIFPQTANGYTIMQLKGGNTHGYFYGDYQKFGDGIHMGYNYYASNGVAYAPAGFGAGSSRISMGYGFITFNIGYTANLTTIMDITATRVSIAPITTDFGLYSPTPTFVSSLAFHSSYNDLINGAPSYGIGRVTSGLIGLGGWLVASNQLPLQIANYHGINFVSGDAGWAAGASHMAIVDGVVGINIRNPSLQVKLDVNGPVNVRDYINVSNAILIGNSTKPGGELIGYNGVSVVPINMPYGLEVAPYSGATKGASKFSVNANGEMSVSGNANFFAGVGLYKGSAENAAYINGPVRQNGGLIYSETGFSGGTPASNSPASFPNAISVTGISTMSNFAFGQGFSNQTAGASASLGNVLIGSVGAYGVIQTNGSASYLLIGGTRDGGTVQVWNNNLRVDCNVGIGVDPGTFTLNVNGTANFTLKNNDFYNDAAGNKRFYFQTASGYPSTYLYAPNGTFLFRDNNSNLVAIDGSGNLTTQGNITTQGTLTVNSIDGITGYTANQNFKLFGDNNGTLFFGNNIRRDSSGNLVPVNTGYGGTNYSYLMTMSPAYSAGGILFYSYEYPQNTYSNVPSRLLMQLAPSGRVGIGKANPGANLDVSGTAHFFGTVDIYKGTSSIAAYIHGPVEQNGGLLCSATGFAGGTPASPGPANFPNGVSGTVTLENSSNTGTFFVAGITTLSNSVGINCTPGASTRLDIRNSGNSGILPLISLQDTGGGFRHFITSQHAVPPGNNSINFWLNTAPNIDTSSAPGTGNIQMMSVSASGIGVNTSSISARLDIQGGRNTDAQFVTAIAFQSDTPIGGSTGGFRHFITTRHNNSGTINNLNAIDFWLNRSPSATGSSSPNTSNVNSLSITAAGIGILTDSPAYPLDVNGTTRFNGETRFKTATWQISHEDSKNRIYYNSNGATFFASGNGTFNFLNPGGTSANFTIDNSGDLFVGGNSNANLIRFRGTHGDGFNYYNHTVIGEYLYQSSEQSELLLFKANDGENASGRDRVRVLASGGFQVDINGGGGWSVGSAAPTPDIAGAFCVTPSGNVGIRTTTPGYSLDVNGAINSTALQVRRDVAFTNIGGSFATNWAQLIVSQASGSTGRLCLGNADTSGLGSASVIQSASSGTAVAKLMINPLGGFVGIGTISPEYQLDVNGAINSTALQVRRDVAYSNVNNFAGNWAQLVVTQTNGVTGILCLGNANTPNGGSASVIQSGTLSGSTPTNLLINPSGGAVGIGTTSPAYSLDVNGRINGNNDLNVGLTGNGFLRFTTAGNVSYIQSSSTPLTGPGAASGNFVPIYFTGMAGTPNIMAITSTGLGIGTTSPAYTLDVNGSARTLGDLFVGGNSNANLIRFRGTTGDGLKEYNHTVIGEYLYQSTEQSELLLFKANDGENGSGRDRVRVLASGGFQVDINGGVGWNNGDAAPDPSIAGAFCVAPNGNVGIRTTTPAHALDVTGNIRASGDVTAGSDKRYKENIVTIDSALDKVTSMRGVYFTKKDSSNRHLGVIAQEIEEILPEVVHTDSSEEKMKSVSYGNITAVLIEAIKEQQGIINAQQSTINGILYKFLNFQP